VGGRPARRGGHRGGGLGGRGRGAAGGRAAADRGRAQRLGCEYRGERAGPEEPAAIPGSAQAWSASGGAELGGLQVAPRPAGERVSPRDSPGTRFPLSKGRDGSGEVREMAGSPASGWWWELTPLPASRQPHDALSSRRGLFSGAPSYTSAFAPYLGQGDGDGAGQHVGLLLELLGSWQGTWPVGGGCRGGSWRKTLLTRGLGHHRGQVPEELGTTQVAALGAGRGLHHGGCSVMSTPWSGQGSEGNLRGERQRLPGRRGQTHCQWPLAHVRNEVERELLSGIIFWL